MHPELTVLSMLLLAAPALADSQTVQAVQEELDRQLAEMVKLPVPRMEILFEGIDSPRYTLSEGTFKLDGAALPGLTPGSGSQTVVFQGTVAPGEHTVTASLAYREGQGDGFFSYGEGVRYRLPGRYTLKAQRGLLLRLRVRVEVDDGAEVAKRLRLVVNLEPKMLAKLDDAPLPPPPQVATPQQEKAPPEEIASSKQVAAAVTEAQPAGARATVTDPARGEPAERGKRFKPRPPSRHVSSSRAPESEVAPQQDVKLARLDEVPPAKAEVVLPTPPADAGPPAAVIAAPEQPAPPPPQVPSSETATSPGGQVAGGGWGTREIAIGVIALAVVVGLLIVLYSRRRKLTSR